MKEHMAKNIYLASLGKSSGKSLISLGLMTGLKHEFKKTAFFKPIACLSESKTDHYLNLMHKHFKLPYSLDELHGINWDEAAVLLNTNKDELFNQIIQKYKAIEKKVDFVLCEGSDFTTNNSAMEFELNAQMANNLGAQVLCVVDADSKTLKQVVQDIEIGLKAFKAKKCEVLGVFVNRSNYEDEAHWTTELHKALSSKVQFIGVIPNKPELAMPSIAEISQILDAKVLAGKNKTDKLVKDYSIAARHVGHFLDSKKNREDFLVITAGDRADVILGCSLANHSTHYPKIAGLLLTTGTKPSQNILKILDGLDHPLPLLVTELDTLATIKLLENTSFHTRPEQKSKITQILTHFQHHVNERILIELITQNTSHRLTPQMFTYNLVQKAKSDKKHIVLPEGEDLRILEAADYILKRDIAELTILGDTNKIEKLATAHSWDISKATLINPKTSEMGKLFAETYFQLRQHKNVNLTIAQDRMQLNTYFGTMMVRGNQADGMVSGAIHTTGETIRPALEVIKTKPDCSIVSSVFLMCLEDRVLAYGDCAVNPNPNAEQLAEIAQQSAVTAKQFGLPVRIAMLSYSSGDSGSGESVEKVRQATKLVRAHDKKLLIEGPIQYDAAVDAGVAAKKMPHSKVAGKATVLIFPELNTGNNTYKAVQRETGAIAIGPVLQGLKKPVNDLSRGCTVADIINTIVITAIQAQGN